MADAPQIPGTQLVSPELLQQQLQDPAALQPQIPQPPFPVPQPQPALVDPGAVVAGAIPTKEWLMSPASGERPPVAETPTADNLAAQVATELAAEPASLPQVVAQAEQKVTQFIAPLQQQAAARLAMDKIEGLRQAAEERQQLANQELNQRIAAIDSEVRQNSLPEILQRGDFSNKMLAILAMSMGAAGAALTGQPNAAIVYFDRIADQQAARDKLNEEKKAALRKAVYEQASLELNKLEQATDSAYKKDVLRLQQQELAQKIAEANQAILAQAQQNLANASAFSGRRGLTDEEFAALSDKQRGAVVTLPDGRRIMATNEDSAEKFKAYMTEAGNAIESLKKFDKVLKTGSAFNLKDRAQAQVLQQTIIGALRLPLTGPGVLTDAEREQLANVIGRFGITKLNFVEREKVKTLLEDLNARINYTAKLSGIRTNVFPQNFYRVGERLVSEDKLVNAYKKRLPNVAEDRIRELIKRQLPEM